MRFYERTLREEDIPNLSVYRMMFEKNRNYKNDTALIYFNKKITYAFLFEKIQMVASKLADLGLSKGDIITLQVVNMPQTVILFYAISFIGAIANFVYVTADCDELHNSLNDTKSKMFVTIDGLWEKQKSAVSGTAVEHVLLLSIGEEADFVTKNVIRLKTKVKKDSKVLYWNEFCSGATRPAEEINDDTLPIAMVYTGGTTGKSKAVVLSNRNLNALAMQYDYANISHGRGQRFMNGLPPFIAFGLSFSMHMPLCLGFSEVLLADPSPANCGKSFAKYRPNFFVHGMTGIEYVCNNSKVKKMDLSFVEVLAVGGEAIPPSFEKRTNEFLREHNSKAKLSIGYGMSEVAATVVTESPNVYKQGTVGVPLPGTMIKIVEPETVEEVGYNEVGEICFHTPTMMAGYYNKSDETNFVKKLHADGLEWIHSGDLGKVDTEGYLTVVGRIKRIIEIRQNGIYHKVFPKLLEDELEKTEGVESITVVGRKRPEIINELIAFVVKNDGYEEINIKAALIESAGRLLKEWEQPVEYRFIDKFPRTAIGKVDFKKMEEMAE